MAVVYMFLRKEEDANYLPLVCFTPGAFFMPCVLEYLYLGKSEGAYQK